MAQSLRNKFDSEGSRLGYPISPASPQPMAPSPSLPSTMHNKYSLENDPSELLVSPRYDNTGTTVPYPDPTKLSPLRGPSNNLSAAAGFEVYNNQQTYDDFILNQGAGGALAAARFQGTGDAFLGTLASNPN